MTIDKVGLIKYLSTISRILREREPQSRHQKIGVPHCETDGPATFAISQPEAAMHGERRIYQHSTLTGHSLRPIEKGNSPDKIPTREEARQALDIAVKALEIYTGGLNESEFLVIQRIAGYLSQTK